MWMPTVSWAMLSREGGGGGQGSKGNSKRQEETSLDEEALGSQPTRVSSPRYAWIF